MLNWKWVCILLQLLVDFETQKYTGCSIWKKKLFVTCRQTERQLFDTRPSFQTNLPPYNGTDLQKKNLANN